MPDTGGTVKVPGVGPVKKQTLTIVGGAAGALLIYTLYRQRQAKSSAASTVSPTDPATGFPYGSTDDANALAAQAGYVSPAGNSGGGSGSPPQTSPQAGQFTSNPQWSQAAADYLRTEANLDAGTVQAALGQYITGQSATDAQGVIINQAIAAEGYPPVGGPDGYPPSIRHAITPVPTPTVAPITAPNGFYRNPVNGEIDQVDANIRYHVSAATWAKIVANNRKVYHKDPPVKQALPGNPLWKMTFGGTI